MYCCSCDLFFPPCRLLLRDLVAIIAVLEFNQWFTKLSTKDYKLVSICFSCLLTNHVCSARGTQKHGYSSLLIAIHNDHELERV